MHLVVEPSSEQLGSMPSIDDAECYRVAAAEVSSRSSVRPYYPRLGRCGSQHLSCNLDHKSHHSTRLHNMTVMWVRIDFMTIGPQVGAVH